MVRPTITDANGDGHFGYGELLNPSTVDSLITQHNEHAATLDTLDAQYGHSNGSFYVTSSAATTIGVQGTYTKVLGTTELVAGACEVTMPTNNRLTYTGAPTKHFHIVANLSVRCGSNNQTVSFAIYKNGAQLAHSVMDHFIGTGADIKIMAIHSDVDLATNDYLELWTTNTSSTASVTVVRGYMYCMGLTCP